MAISMSIKPQKLEPSIQLKYNIEYRYSIVCPSGSGKRLKKRKAERPQNKKDGLQTNHRLWLEENGVFE